MTITITSGWELILIVIVFCIGVGIEGFLWGFISGFVKEWFKIFKNKKNKGDLYTKK